MTLVFSEEERLLQDSARGLLAEKSPVSALRRLRDERDEDGFSRELWGSMAQMGWAGLLVPEEHGGLEFGHVGAGILCEESGRTLAASPLFASAILGASIIREAASAAQQSDLLPAIAEGSIIVALAVDEKARHDPNEVSLSARADGAAYVLDGSKTLVIDGHVADKLVVSARTAGARRDAAGISLFVVDAGAPGLTRERTFMVDSRNAAEVRFDGVRVEASALLGELNGGAAALERCLDVGRACLAAEMLGVAAEAFARTIDYLSQRRQFGVEIGSFQALQHRAAQLFCELELTRSVVIKALRAIDERSPDTASLVSLAKAKAGDTVTLAVNEAVQMHGGIGMTDEFDIGFFMKRAAVLRQLLGDSYFHTSRFAALKGY